MAKAAAAGHRVILVCGTRGEMGEPQPGVLADGETLPERRVKELTASCAALGAEEPRFLGYKDSGMMGEPTNDDPDCFWQADMDEAIDRMATILDEVDADVLTIYDNHGGYGHPDHLRVHEVGLAAGRKAEVPHIFEATMNRDRILEMMRSAPPEEGIDAPSEEEVADFGTQEADIAFMVDVSQQVGAKKAAMEAHRSQIAPDSFFLEGGEERFAAMFGLEYFNRPGVTNTGGPKQVDLLPGLG